MDDSMDADHGALNGTGHTQRSESDVEESQTSTLSQRDISHALGEKMLQGWTLLGDQCPRCFTILVRNRQRELFCVACDMFLREESAAEKEDSTPPSSVPPQAIEPRQQHTGAAVMQPSPTDAEQPTTSILDRQHEVAQALSMSLLDKMLDIGKEVAATRNAEECEQQLALLRSCIKTYQSVAVELM